LLKKQKAVGMGI